MRVERRHQDLQVEIAKQATQKTQNELSKGIEEVRKDIEQKSQEVAQQSSDLSKEEIQELIEQLNKKLDYLNKYLKITLDEDLEIPVVKILERDTDRVIRQIPPEHVLKLMKKIDEMLGILLSERV